MGAPLDYPTLILNQLIALLSPVVKAGNIYAQDKSQWRDAVQGGNLPELQIDFTSSSEAIFTADEHYGEVFGDVIANDAWLETCSYTFSIRATFDNRQLVPANVLHVALRSALRNSGPVLGLAFVTRWGPLMRSDSIGQPTDAARGGERRISTYTIAVQTQDDGQLELGL